MTEEIQTNDVGLDSQTESTAIETVADVGAETVNETTAAPLDTEEMMPKSQVNDLIHKRTREVSQSAYERARRETAAEYERRMAQFQPQAHQNAQGLDQIPIAPNDLERIEQTILQRWEHKQQAERERQYYENVANQFVNKLSAGKSKYSDFDQKVASLELEKIAPIVELSNLVENTDDVIYHLAEDGNEHKIANFLVLAKENPRKAESAMRNLADSLKRNRNVQNRPQANEPLKKVSASTVGLDGGSMSIRDWQNQDWLRG